MLPTPFRSIWPSCFRVEDFQKSTNQKQELPLAAMFVNGSGQNEKIFLENLPQILPTKFRFIWQCNFRGQDFQKSTNQKQELPMAAIFVNGWDEMSNINRGHPIDASYQVSVHLATRFQRRFFFLNRPFRNKNCLWWPCLLMDPDKMSNLQKEPSIDVSYQVSLHLAERFQRRRLKCEKLMDDK